MRPAYRKRGTRLASVGLAVCLIWSDTSAAQVEYIADTATDRILYAEQGWGVLGLNRVAHPPDRKPNQLRIKDTRYERGLGTHANGEILIDLCGAYAVFEAEVGVQWQGGKAGSVVFQVFVDEEKRFDSGVMTEHDPPRRVLVPVEGADDLRLVVNDAGDGITCDAANWANARLTRDPKAAGGGRTRSPVNIARFGRVVTSDPARIEGTRAKRTEEMPAGDVFLSTELRPADDGSYAVPVSAGGVGCIGLEWTEPRYLRRIGLTFADGAAPPSGAEVQAQAWVGQSPWQGKWQSLPASAREPGGRWSWRVYPNHLKSATPRIRWVVPNARAPLKVRQLSAETTSAWRTAELSIESTKPRAGKPVELEVYNGLFLAPSDEDASVRCTWNPTTPLRLKVRYSRTRRCKTDRTVIRFDGLGLTFGVAVEDVLVSDAVYVPHAGVFVTRVPAPITRKAYLQRIAGRKTVLQRVRERPDQSFTQAFGKVHNPIQDRGPTMLSLACDNRKFVVHRDGAIRFKPYDRPDDPITKPQYVLRRFEYELRPRFGQGASQQVTRQLTGEWLPIPLTAVTEGDVVYRQWTCVAPLDAQPPAGAPDWLRRRAVCVAEYAIENTQARDVTAALAFTLSVKTKAPPIELKRVDAGAVWVSGQRLMGFVDPGNASPLTIGVSKGVVRLGGELPAHATARCVVYLPAWITSPDDLAPFRDRSDWTRRVEDYWKERLADATQIELPDRMLTDVIRASQVHCLLAARCEDGGRRIAPWTASDRYGPLESEGQAVIRGMDMMGHDDFARRSLDFFVKRYSSAGYVTTGYTLMGTGWHLWTLAEHFDRTRDRGWMRRVAPDVARACGWIVRQRAKTQRLDAYGRKVPEYGLVPAGVFADWPRFTFTTFQAAQYCAGLREAARVLGEVGHPDAARFAKDACQYRQDILRAYRWTQARTPVVPLSNGCWVPGYPPLIYCFGEVGGFFPGEDGSRAWCKNAMAHQLVANRVIDPHAEEVAWMTDHMEDVEFLRGGLGDYPEEQTQRDPFNLGGFNKCQPYYRRNVEIYAYRDDVKPFIRGYFNTIGSLLNTENLSFWEHFHNRGAWNKTHETGWFLCQTRLMLVMERDEDLWLAPFITTHWLADGMRVSVRNAPTRFGPVSYTLTSAVKRGVVEAVIEPPTRSRPKAVVLRIRHPEGKPLRAVLVNGREHRDLDRAAETIRLSPPAETITVKAQY